MSDFLIILAAIALQVFLTVKKVSPFLSLLFVAILTGLCLGMQPDALIRTIEKGVGSTMGSVALIICLGAILGKILEETGAAEKIATTLISGFGEKNIQWAVLVAGFLIGIPLYYNAGFIILVPLIFTLVRKTGLPLLYVVIPMAASLSTTHCFLPPHPGPAYLVKTFGADMGKTLMLGVCIAIPAVIIAGPLLGRQLKKLKINPDNIPAVHNKPAVTVLPAAMPAFLLALLPVILITISVLADNFLPAGILKTTLLFTGNSTISLLLSVIVAMFYFVVKDSTKTETQVKWFGHIFKGMTSVIIRMFSIITKDKSKTDTQMKWLSDAISGIAMILLIITAGGVFKQVLEDSGTGKKIAELSKTFHMPPLVFAWVVTALLRVMIGSATVAGITAAGVVLPLLAVPGVSPELMVLAVGSGSVFGSHINDSGFWMYKEFFNLSLKQTFLSWTVMETLISIVGLIGVLLLDLFI